MLELLGDFASRPRRVREEHHRAAGRTKRLECCNGRRIGGAAVVQAPPEVAEKRVVVAGRLGKPVRIRVT